MTIRPQTLTTVALVVLGCLSLGAVVSMVQPSPFMVVAALAIPFVAVAFKRIPELALALFLFAGSFKTALPLPVDATLLLALVVVILAVISAGEAGVRPIPLAVWMFIALAAIVAVGVTYSLDPAYGMDKTVRLLALGLVTPLATLQIVRTSQSVKRLCYSVIGLGVVMSAAAIAQGGDPLYAGKYAAFGSDTIALGRTAGYALGLAALVTLWKPKQALWTLPCAGLCLLALLGSGSRGPLVGLAAAFVVLFVLRLATGGAAKLGFALVVAGVVLGLLIMSSVLPAASLDKLARITGDASVADPTRVALSDEAFRLAEAQPLSGVGTGSFAASDTGFPYPHNILLETLSENGLPGVLLVLGFLGVALVAAAQDVLHVPSLWTEAVIALLVVATVNALVTGDLNGNRMLYSMIALAAAGAAAAGAAVCPATVESPAAQVVAGELR